ncbi:hypothetical protein ACW9KT_16135 [Hymenobacter sp. HD11105]|jgi:hypothetical protein
MKSLLKFLLLFSLIIVGKLVKDPAPTSIAAKNTSGNELPVHMASFFARQSNLQATTPSENNRWWVRTETVSANN